jgi:hypothetical protein
MRGLVCRELLEVTVETQFQDRVSPGEVNHPGGSGSNYTIYVSVVEGGQMNSVAYLAQTGLDPLLWNFGVNFANSSSQGFFGAGSGASGKSQTFDQFMRRHVSQPSAKFLNKQNTYCQKALAQAKQDAMISTKDGLISGATMRFAPPVSAVFGFVSTIYGWVAAIEGGIYSSVCN